MAGPKPLYKGLSSQETLALDGEEELEQETKKPSGQTSITTIVLSITTLLFGLQSLYFYSQRMNVCLAQVFKDGYTTEWGPAKETIEIQKVNYTSALRYNETSKTYHREFDPTQPQYFGTPAPEIDEAWANLLHGQYLVLTEEEVLQLDDPESIKGFYIGEVEVMHSLHCLNSIRKALDPEYYKIHDKHSLPKKLQSIHVEHCIEQLRQNIQCAGDLTPVLLRSYGEEPNNVLIGTPQEHTCRNWGTFRKWWTERGEKYGSIGSGGA